MIFYRSPSIYLIGAGVEIDISERPALLGAIGVLIVSAKSSSSFRLLYLAKRSGAFRQIELFQMD